LSARYIAIDGDIVDFIESKAAFDYSIDELQAYLRREGYGEVDILRSIREWQQERLVPGPQGWDRFTLSDAGRQVVANLQWTIR
jgi:hypothetical protein